MAKIEKKTKRYPSDLTDEEAHSSFPLAPRIRLSDKTSRRLSRATPSATSEHHAGLISFPISMSFATCCVCLELRPLRATSHTKTR